MLKTMNTCHQDHEHVSSSPLWSKVAGLDLKKGEKDWEKDSIAECYSVIFQRNIL